MQFLIPQDAIDGNNLMSIKSRQFLQFLPPHGKIEANNWILVQNMQLLFCIVVFKPITVTSGTRLYLDGKRNLYMSLVSQVRFYLHVQIFRYHHHHHHSCQYIMIPADKTRPDYLATVDTDPTSPTYSQVMVLIVKHLRLFTL